MLPKLSALSSLYPRVEKLNLDDPDHRARLEELKLAARAGRIKVESETGFHTPKGNYFVVISYYAPDDFF